MSKSWLMCALLGAMAWGQAAPATPASPNQMPPNAAPQPQTPPADPGASVAADAVVLTITVHPPCASTTKTAAAKPAAAGATTPAAKPAAATKPTDCKITYTKAEFEKMANALAPNITPQQKRQLAGQLPSMIAMSQEAQAKGMDKSTHYAETMKYMKMRVLAGELQRSVQEQAAKVSDEDIAQYYKDNPEAYEQFNLERIFIQRYKQDNEVKEADKDKDDDKDKDKTPTPEEEKARQDALKAKQAAGEQELTKLADTLRDRAAKGEDFAKLQKEAYDAAGTKIETPNVNMQKIRRTGLPVSQAAVFDLKAGEVSQVFSDAGGHYIYKVDGKEELPLDQVKNEIHNRLQTMHQQDQMQKLQSSFTSESNDAYFGGPLAPAGHPMPNRVPPQMGRDMPMPRRAPIAPQTQTPPPQTPPPAAEQAPATKPN